MLVVRDIAALRVALAGARSRGQRIGFVPTMGALHDGHLSLLERAGSQAECVVLSIFVNPLQFAPTEDLAKYPRTEDADLNAARARGTAIAFIPTPEVMYPRTRMVSVIPDVLADTWEGAIRPGHFAGVLTVVTKLFNLVQPDVAVFGQKDLQQATLIRALVADLDFPVQLDIAPIVREADGLAMSSRNRYLDPTHRREARVLSRALAAATAAFDRGVHDSGALGEIMSRQLASEPAARVDYCAVVEPERLTVTDSARPGGLPAARGPRRSHTPARQSSTRRPDAELHIMTSPVQPLSLPQWAIASPKRREHIARVTALLDQWADLMAIPELERVAWHDAGVLHDVLRDADEASLRALTGDTTSPMEILHGPAAAEKLAALGESRHDVLDAIRWHTLGNPGWSRTGQALFMADFLEPGRKFMTSERAWLAQMVPGDFTGVFRQVVKSRLEWSLREGKGLHRETVAMWNAVR